MDKKGIIAQHSTAQHSTAQHSTAQHSVNHALLFSTPIYKNNRQTPDREPVFIGSLLGVFLRVGKAQCEK